MKPKKKVSVLESGGQLLGNPFAALGELLPGLTGPVETGNRPPDGSKGAKKLGEVVLRKETAHRGGKTVTVAGGFDPPLPAEEIARLAAEAKKSCGCGGSVVAGEILLQGDIAPKLRQFLLGKGFRVRGAG